MVVSYNGSTGERPVIKVTHALVKHTQVRNYLAFVGLDVYKSNSDPASADFSTVSSADIMAFVSGGANLLIELGLDVGAALRTTRDHRDRGHTNGGEADAHMGRISSNEHARHIRREVSRLSCQSRRAVWHIQQTARCVVLENIHLVVQDKRPAFVTKLSRALFAH